MAFTFAVTRVVQGVGDTVMAYGTYNSASVTTGSIITGLNSVTTYKTEPATKTASATSTVAAGTITLSGLATSDTGNWVAFADK